MRSSSTGASSATAAASAAVRRHASPNSWPSASSATEPSMSVPRYCSLKRLELEARGGRVEQVRRQHRVGPDALQRPALGDDGRLEVLGVVDPLRHRRPRRGPPRTPRGPCTSAKAACPPPIETATPRTSRSSRSSRIAFGPSAATRATASATSTLRRSSSATSTAGFALRPTSSSRSNSVRNSSAVNSRRTASRSHSPITASSGSRSTSTSVLSSASSLLSASWSPAAEIDSLSFPLSSSVRVSSSSTEPKSCTSLDAVFSPTPGTPGMLSEASPLRAT
jgi:hypothetical protein